MEGEAKKSPADSSAGLGIGFKFLKSGSIRTDAGLTVGTGRPVTGL